MKVAAVDEGIVYFPAIFTFFHQLSLIFPHRVRVPGSHTLPLLSVRDPFESGLTQMLCESMLPHVPFGAEARYKT